MAFFIVLIAVEAVLILLTAPLSVEVRAHLDLNAARCAAEIKVMGARTVTLTASAGKDGVRLRINGKKPKPYKERRLRVSPAGAARAARAVRAERAVRSGRVSLLIGGADCASGALLWGTVSALMCALPQGVAKSSFFEPRAAVFLADIGVKVRVNVISGIRILRALMK